MCELVFTPSRHTVILRTSVTPCSAMLSLISLLVTLLKAEQRIIPLGLFKDELGVTEHFRPKMSSSVVDFFRVTL